MENPLADVDTSWFDNHPESYLRRVDFIDYQKLSGVDLRDLFSKNPTKIKSAQEKLANTSIIYSTMRKNHAGFVMPLIAYTNEIGFGEPVSNHIPSLDHMWQRFPMFDSLRTRNIAISKVLLPMIISELYEEKKKRLSILNFGSGCGLDTINAALFCKEDYIRSIDNYDLDSDAINFGKKIVKFLEEREEIPKGIIKFHNKHLRRSSNCKPDLAILVGVICSLKDFYAQKVIDFIYNSLDYGGVLLTSSSNKNMKCKDPLANFHLQHMGSKDDYTKSWGLRFRIEKDMESLMHDFRMVKIYNEVNYPGKEGLSEDQIYGIDLLPLKVMGYPTNNKKIIIPSRNVLGKKIAYNWITIAKK